MSNKSHYNTGHIAMNVLKKNGKKHSSNIADINIIKSIHGIFVEDSIPFLKSIPDSSIQLILIDPPYNLDLDYWDTFDNYIDWAKQWLDEIYRILAESGNCVIFGGFQYQDLKKGDLLEVLHYARHKTPLRFTNLVIWYYKNGMSAHRFFANRHEEAIWLTKTKNYYFDLDSVRAPYTEEQKISALKDKRLVPENVEKGKNPTNVWEIGRLNGNSSERVGHPTQKPKEIIRRFVKALSYEGSIVLDFFAGSGTTAAVCIEENRHSIMIDSDSKLHNYFSAHLKKLDFNLFLRKFEIITDQSINQILKLIDESNSSPLPLDELKINEKTLNEIIAEYTRKVKVEEVQ